MRVCIDCTPLLIRSAGVKNYLYHWTEALRREAGGNAVQLFPYLDAVTGLDHERPVIGMHAAMLRLFFLYFANVWKNPALGWLNSGIDLFHASNQVRNPPRKGKLTTTLHDLTCWIMPEMHRPATVAGDRRFVENIVRRCDGVIAVSESTRRDAIKHLGLSPDRVEVIHHGVPSVYFDVPSPEIEKAKQRHHLSKPYLLFVGTIEPRKNIDTLLDAWSELSEDLRREYELVIAGSIGWAKPETTARLLSGGSGVRYTGYVPESDLPAITAGATFCVYPSLYEGFGFPVAQSLAAGVPVLTSDVSSLPEVAGDAGVLVDPRSRSEIRGAMETLLLSPSLRETLAARARARAPRFRWEECARRSWRFFEKVFGG